MTAEYEQQLGAWASQTLKDARNPARHGLFCGASPTVGIINN